MKAEQIILHIPHSTTFIPEKYRDLFYLDEQQLANELLKMTDLHTEKLFDIPDVPEENRIIFPYSRLICDVERFRDDAQEIMAARDMGICYTATSDLTDLKRVTPEHRAEMLKLYDRHHAKLTKAVDTVLNKYGTAILIDCHSFPSKALPYEMYNGTRPDICIGTDPDYHTPAELAESLVEKFARLGYSVELNKPFAGTLVPMKHYHRDRRLMSIMIEVNRKLYMDEATGECGANFEKVRLDMLPHF